MGDFFDRQKFKSELMARGITMTNAEIDSYINTMGLKGSAPKSHLPYKQAMLHPQAGSSMVTSLEDPYTLPQQPENAALDFIGNAVWEALDVGTFGALGALDYTDYLENIVTGGGPGTFAGRVGAGLGGLAGFMLPFGAVKKVAGAAVKGLSKYGTKKAGETMVKKSADLLQRTNYDKLSLAEQGAIWKPWTTDLGNYGKLWHNTATRNAYFSKLDTSIRPLIVSNLKSRKINPGNNVISGIENVVRESMGMVMKDGKWTGAITAGMKRPVWNLQQAIAAGLGGSAGAGKIASVASHVIEEAAIFAAVETPMELMNSIDEHRDTDLPGVIGHALALGGVLGMVRFIPGGKDMPIMRGAFARMNKTFQKRKGYLDLDYGTKESREMLSKAVASIWSRDPKVFTAALGPKGMKELGIDGISSVKQIKKFITGQQKDAETFARAMNQVEKNWNKSWWPEFVKESAKDLYGSTPRMFAGAMAFNYEIVFDDEVPLEDKVFNLAVGAYMTKRGRSMEFIDANGTRTTWKHTERPWTYRGVDEPNSLASIDRYLQLLDGKTAKGTSLMYDTLLEENKLNNKFIDISETDDIKSIMDVLRKPRKSIGLSGGAIVSTNEKVKLKKKPESIADHEVYDYIQAISSFFSNANKNDRVLGVGELTKKQLLAIEKDLGKLELVSTKDPKGVNTVSDVEDIARAANSEAYGNLLDLYKTVIVDMYATLGKGKHGQNLDRENIVVTGLDQTQLVQLSPEAQTAIGKMVRVRDLLFEYGKAHVDPTKAPELRTKIDLSKDEAIVNRMKELDSDLNDLILKGEPVWDEYALEIGDPHLSRVIHEHAFAENIRDSYSKMQDLTNTTGIWKDNPVTRRNNVEEINNLIGRIFSDEFSLYSKVEVGVPGKGALPADIETIQLFASNLLEALPHTTKYQTPAGFEGRLARPERAQYKDVKQLRRLFIENGMGGFAATGDKLSTYMNEFKGYALDRKISAATRNDTKKPFIGADRAKIAQLVSSGVANEKLELIDVVRQIDTLVAFSGDPEFMQKLMDFKSTHNVKNLLITNKMLKKILPGVEVDIAAMNQQISADLSKVAAAQGVDLPVAIKDLHAKYQEHIAPYMHDVKTGHGILKLRNVKAEADLFTMREFLSKLDMVDKMDIKIRHSELMKTLDKFAEKEGMNTEERQFLEKLRNNFWNRQADAAKVVNLLARYGHTDENGDFIPLYDRKKNQFNLEFKGSAETLKETLRALETYIPSTVRSSLVEQRVKELMEEKIFESDVSTSVTPQSFIDKYHLSQNKTELSTILKYGDAPAETLKQTTHIVRNQSTDKVHFDKMSVEEQSEFLSDVSRLMHSSTESRNIKRIAITEREGPMADFENIVNDNPVFRAADKLVGLGNYVMVDHKVVTGQGTVDSRVDSPAGVKALGMLRSRLYAGGSTVDIQGKALEGQVVTRAEAMEGHIFVPIGDYSWGIGLPRTQAGEIYDEFGKFIEKKRAQYPDKYKTIFKKLEDLYNIKGNDVSVAEGEKPRKAFAPSNAEGDSEVIGTMFTNMFMDNINGELWWKHLSETYGKRNSTAAGAVAKWNKRVRLMANLSGKELSDRHVSRVLDIYKTNKVLRNDTLDDVTTLHDNKGLNIVIAGDESKGNKIMSVLQNTLKQINDENRAANIPRVERDRITGTAYGNSEFTGLSGGSRTDASMADSIMIMPLKWFKALQVISGFHNAGSIGGIKPLISSVGDGVLLGKTAIVASKQFDGFFKSNDKVHALMMGSAAKIVNKDIKFLDIDNITMDQFKTGAIAQDDYIAHVPWKSIGIINHKAAEHDATVSYQMANELDAGHSTSFYNWLIAPNITNYDKQMSRFMDPHNSIGTAAFARRLSEAGTTDNASLSVMDYWVNAENGGGPVQYTGVMPAFKNAVKKKFLDDGVIQLHNTHGSQSVMASPFTSDWKELRNTTFRNKTENRITSRQTWTFGQASIPTVNRDKTVVTKRLNFIWHKNKDWDELISYSEVKKRDSFKRAVKNKTNRAELGEKEPLHVIADVARKFSKLEKQQHEVALVFHRNPSNRPSDKIIVGLKGFISGEEGNQVRLNPFDSWARAEADFDIDTINYWWDTPNDVLKTWRDNAGKVPIVSEEPSRTTLDANYDWLDPASIRQMSADKAHAQVMRGAVVKAQRLTHYLANYNSITGEGPQFKGIVLDLSGGWGRRVKDQDTRIVFNHALMDENRQLLAEDIQRIIDSEVGYNRQLYKGGDVWLERFLFGDGGKRYNGLFKKLKYNASDGEWQDMPLSVDSEVPTLSRVEQAIVKELISPFRSLLQVSTSVYESGKPRSPRYDDLISMAYNYDAGMRGANKRVFWNLRKRWKEDQDLVTELDSIFGWDSNKREFKQTFQPLHSFGSNAALRIAPGQEADVGMNQKLPFERMIMAVANTDRMSQDSPKTLWGQDAARYENIYENILHSGDDVKAKQAVYQDMANLIKKDIKNMRIINYFHVREKQQVAAERNARNDGHESLAEVINEDVVRIQGERLALEETLSLNTEVINFHHKVATNRIRGEIISEPKTNKWQTFRGKNPKGQAISWVNENLSVIKKLAADQPIKYRGISDPEYRDAFIFGENFGKFQHLFVDPSLGAGERTIEMETDASDVRTKYKDVWREFFKDKMRRDKWYPWYNETRIMNMITNEFTGLFRKWEGVQPGLGNLLLWKIMRPRAKVGEYTFFNGKLSEAFSERDNSFVKFGLRFIASSDEADISSMQKKDFFNFITSQYTDWFDFLHDNKVDSAEGMRYRHMLESADRQLYETPAPFLDYRLDPTAPPSMQAEFNPVLHEMFGVDNSYSWGYVKHPSTASTMKEMTEKQIFPRGYIPIHYRGGAHPKISGWSDWNAARRGEGFLMLGEAINKNVLTFREYPVVKHTFNDVAGKGETSADIEQIWNAKVLHEDNGTDPKC